jgi:N-acetyl-anhydromuramyl-L-alanine amidase AmpD
MIRLSGIELENRGWQTSAGVKRFTPFEPAQIAALVPLAKDIIARYNIRPETWWPIRTLRRSAKTIPARCSRGDSWLSRG